VSIAVFYQIEPLEKKTKPLEERERERGKYPSGLKGQLSAVLSH
jgi:hypothetical protein